MRLFLILFLVLTLSFEITYADSVTPPGLRIRQPNWKPEILESYPNGNPSKVRFMEPSKEGLIPVKEIEFYPTGAIKQEADLLLLPSDSPRAKLIGSPLVAHGPTVSYHPQGSIAKISPYYEGLLEGEVKLFFPNGQVEASTPFSAGKRQGHYEAFYSQGNKREVGNYEGDKLQGLFSTYYEDGALASQTYYEKGLPIGKAQEWNPSDGTLKSVKYYKDGLLDGEGDVPAITIYDPSGQILEVQHFRLGLAQGLHLKYYPSGKIHYRVNYLKGKKEGNEEYFHEEGGAAGGGKFKQGLPVGEHILTYKNGQIERKATYSPQGQLLGNVEEFFENGTPRALYCFKDGKYEGTKKEWYPSGTLKLECSFKDGELEGPCKEYFDNGQCRLEGCFAKGKREGFFQEWFKSGKCKIETFFTAGVINGDFQEWYENGLVRKKGPSFKESLIKYTKNGLKMGPLFLKQLMKKGSLKAY